MHVRCAVVLGLALMLATACGTATTIGDDAGTSADAPATNVPIEMEANVYASTLCPLLESCYGATVAELLTNTSSLAGCERQAEAQWTNGALPRYQAAIAMGTLSYDGTQSAACMAAMQALGCAIVQSRPPAACQRLFVGHVAIGGACALDEECMGEAYCAADTACPGSCQPRGGAGVACTRDSVCADGLHCTSAHCSAPGGEGASCQGATGIDCAGGLICSGGSAMMAGMCRSVSSVFSTPIGAACNVGEGRLCMPGLSCVVMSATSQVCAAGGLAIGAACHLALPDPCAAGAFCQGANLATGHLDGTCAALPTAGQACATELVGSRCAERFHCNAMSVCAAVHETGGSCSEPADCIDGHCAAGTCTAPGYCS